MVKKGFGNGQKSNGNGKKWCGNGQKKSFRTVMKPARVPRGPVGGRGRQRGARRGACVRAWAARASERACVHASAWARVARACVPP